MLTPYEQGYQAFHRNPQGKTNPYPTNTEEHSQWDTGWYNACIYSRL